MNIKYRVKKFISLNKKPSYKKLIKFLLSNNKTMKNIDKN